MKETKREDSDLNKNHFQKWIPWDGDVDMEGDEDENREQEAFLSMMIQPKRITKTNGNNKQKNTIKGGLSEEKAKEKSKYENG